MQTIAELLAQELGASLVHVQNVIDLLDQGNTIPFIARYRKELHGSMDDTALRKLEDRLTYLRNLEQRRQEVKSAIEGQEKLTPELAAAIDSARTLAEVEDLYRPYKQKRRTRATVAREKGLAPLAELLLDTPQFFSAFWNTCLLAFAQIAGQLVVAAPASWAFAKLRFAGRRFLLLGYIALMVLPFQVLMVPNYLIATRLGIYDTPLSVILPGVFSAFPVFIMTRSFQDVPNELLEAAKLDGATAWQIFWKIGVPLGYAGIFAALVLNFIEGWNAVEQPLLFLKSQSNWPLSMYMNDIVTDNLGIAMAASLLSLIPAMLVFLYGQTYLELGIQAGGIKA